jgi:hypothetical protein
VVDIRQLRVNHGEPGSRLTGGDRCDACAGGIAPADGRASNAAVRTAIESA